LLVAEFTTSRIYDYVATGQNETQAFRTVSLTLREKNGWSGEKDRMTSIHPQKHKRTGKFPTQYFSSSEQFILFREYTRQEQNGKELGNLTVLLLAIPSSFSTGFILWNFTVKMCSVLRLCFYSNKEKFKIISD
jgi:hypothetical protein